MAATGEFRLGKGRMMSDRLRRGEGGGHPDSQHRMRRRNENLFSPPVMAYDNRPGRIFPNQNYTPQTPAGVWDTIGAGRLAMKKIKPTILWCVSNTIGVSPAFLNMDHVLEGPQSTYSETKHDFAVNIGVTLRDSYIDQDVCNLHVVDMTSLDGDQEKNDAFLRCLTNPYLQAGNEAYCRQQDSRYNWYAGDVLLICVADNMMAYTNDSAGASTTVDYQKDYSRAYFTSFGGQGVFSCLQNYRSVSVWQMFIPKYYDYGVPGYIYWDGSLAANNMYDGTGAYGSVPGFGSLLTSQSNYQYHWYEYSSASWRIASNYMGQINAWLADVPSPGTLPGDYV